MKYKVIDNQQVKFHLITAQIKWLLFNIITFSQLDMRNICQVPPINIHKLNFLRITGNDFHTGPYFIMHAVVELSWEVRVQTFLVRLQHA